jgi:hypothetical protein
MVRITITKIRPNALTIDIVPLWPRLPMLV